MIEDRSLNAFIKAKLEEDVGSVPAVAGAQSVRPAFFRPYLLAASLLLVCGVFAVHFRNSRERSREQAAIDAIELLSGESAVASSGSYADRLLAWQDAPYVEIVD